MLPSHNARRAPNRAAVIDEEGTLTFSELDEAAHAVANGLLAKGVRAGEGVAILARNHRWFVIANYGAARVGPASSCSTASSPARRSKRCRTVRAPR